MNKAQKLAHLENELAELQALLENTRLASRAKKFAPAVYASLKPVKYGRDTGKKLEDRLAWRKRIQSSKIVRAAKALHLQCEEDTTTVIMDLGEQIKYAIDSLNDSHMAPKASLVTKTIDSTFKKFKFMVGGTYETFLGDLFNQGRLHQTLFLSRELSLKKFASFSLDESVHADEVTMKLKENFEATFDHCREDLHVLATQCQQEDFNKDDLTFTLSTRIAAWLPKFQKIVQHHLAEAYAAGNIYQMGKDGVEFVKWQTGQHSDDCGKCRAIQMGDIDLVVDGVVMSRFDTKGDGYSFRLSDVQALAKEKGATCFNHDGCRCAFVPE